MSWLTSAGTARRSPLLRRPAVSGQPPDVQTCKRCGGAVEIIAYITEPTTVSRILGHLGLPTEPPLRAPARAPPQIDLELGDPSEQYFADPPCADW